MGRGRDAGLENVWQRRMRRLATWSGGVREFCDRENVTLNQFYYWQRRLRNTPGSERVKREQQASELFVPAAVTAESLSTSIELRLPNGAVLSLPGSIDSERLAMSITAVGQLPAQEVPPC